MSRCCPIVELRQYTLYPGKRDTLVALFEREFIETQEAVGIRLIGQFRDARDPNRYVWFRGFADMEARKQALGDFYYGDHWKSHRDAANATIYDSDDVLLLRPARADAGFDLRGLARPAIGSRPAHADLIVATIYSFAQPVSDDFVRFFDETVRPAMERSGAEVIAELVTEHAENTFPRLPVREGENVFVWVARFDDRAAYERHEARLAADAAWSGTTYAALHRQFSRYPVTLVLEPAARSLVGHGAAKASSPR